MLRKLLAGLLFVLTVLPFTAPFATVDIPTLFGTSSAAPRGTTLAPSADSSHALVASSVRLRPRTVLRLETNTTTHQGAVPARGGAAVLLPPGKLRLLSLSSLTALR